MTVHINWPRVRLVCGQLLAVSRSNDYPYTESWALPQSFIPEAIKANPLTHAQFLFCVCHYMRGTIKSDYAVRQLVKMWKTTPHYFDPKHVALTTTVGELEAVLGSYIGYKKSEMAKFWQSNLTRLYECWGSDPRSLFTGEMTSDRMYDRIRGRKTPHREITEGKDPRKGFYGFQKKMASMLAYFLMEAKLVDPFTASPPVDFHLIRVMIATGMLAPKGRKNGNNYRYEHLEPLGVEVLEKYAREHGVSMVELGNVLWMLSVVICSSAPGTKSTAVERGEDGEKIYPVPIPVDWNRAGDIRSYLQSCSRCPVEGLCGLNVYAGPYYQQGSLIYLKRERLPLVPTGLLGLQPAILDPKKVRIRGGTKTPTKKKTILIY